MVRIALGLGLFVGWMASGADAQAFWNHPETIVGGETAAESDPIAKAIVYVRMDQGNCTGTMVDDRTVLTAAHCALRQERINVGFLSGQGRECEISPVVEVAYVPGAKRTRESLLPDLALLRLRSPICGVVPAVLPSQPNQIGETVWAAGYGRGTESRRAPARLRLRWISKDLDSLLKLYADLDPTVPAEAELARGIEPTLRETAPYYDFALAVTGQETVCNGDSGGPTYLDSVAGRVTLVGVNGAIIPHPQRGAAACRFGFLQLITPVYPYVSWIQETLASWNQAVGR